MYPSTLTPVNLRVGARLHPRASLRGFDLRPLVSGNLMLCLRFWLRGAGSGVVPGPCLCCVFGTRAGTWCPETRWTRALSSSPSSRCAFPMTSPPSPAPCALRGQHLKARSHVQAPTNALAREFMVKTRRRKVRGASGRVRCCRCSSSPAGHGDAVPASTAAAMWLAAAASTVAMLS